MTTQQVEFTEAELLADHDVVEPLLAGGVRCHGGFDGDGRYVSPRTKYRVPAIEAWQARHAELFGTAVLDIPLETWPGNFPNVAQARFLIAAGVPEPLIATLTRIGTVEGFGANIRFLQPGRMQRHFDEDVTGTAIAHLGKGLFEAHGRDEAGWEEEAGHKDMWFAARDIAFEHPTAAVDIEAMLARMGFGQGGPGDPMSLSRSLPDDIDINLELIANLMIRVLLIEIQAFHTFAWAEAWLSDPTLVGGDGEAANLVACIRADETPHVEYLKTTLTEMRDRTFIGTSGAHYAGTEVVGKIWDRAIANSLGPNRQANLQTQYNELKHALASRNNGDEILEGYHTLGDLIPNDDEEFVPAVATY
jgi:hypothetical protein